MHSTDKKIYDVFVARARQTHTHTQLIFLSRRAIITSAELLKEILDKSENWTD